MCVLSTFISCILIGPCVNIEFGVFMACLWMIVWHHIGTRAQVFYVFVHCDNCHCSHKFTHKHIVHCVNIFIGMRILNERKRDAMSLVFDVFHFHYIIYSKIKYPEIRSRAKKEENVFVVLLFSRFFWRCICFSEKSKIAKATRCNLNCNMFSVGGG